MTQHLPPELLIDFIHGALTPEADAGVHAHLAACPLCRDEFDAEVRVGEALRAAARAEELEFPSIVAARVWEHVRALPAGRFAGIAALLRPIVAVPLALAAVFGAYFLSPLSHTSAHGPTINATYYLQQHAGQQASDPLSERGSLQVIESSLVDSPQGELAGGRPANVTDSTDAGR